MEIRFLAVAVAAEIAGLGGKPRSCTRLGFAIGSTFQYAGYRQVGIGVPDDASGFRNRSGVAGTFGGQLLERTLFYSASRHTLLGCPWTKRDEIPFSFSLCACAFICKVCSRRGYVQAGAAYVERTRPWLVRNDVISVSSWWA